MLESDPLNVIEGMMIGGFAIGAERGFVYVRAEYPMAIRRIQHAIDLCHTWGLLGRDILGIGLQLRPGNPPGSGGLCLRRGDGPDPLHRRPAGAAADSPALSHGERAVGQADGD